MLRVKTRIGKSDLHGIGLFAAQFIPKGTVTWQFDSEFDTAFTKEQVDRMPEHGRVIFLHYHYYDPDWGYVLCADDQRFINHAENPQHRNISSTPTGDVAARDIKEGEELLTDYNAFDPGYFDRIGLNTAKLK
ncbi:MAG TPA: SET domain-containing protein [Candidatus Paceibacterota bacterium]|jgi:hypothetical protein